MIFGKKKAKKCNNCKSSIEKDFEFCPHCGLSLVDKEKKARDFGMLGKDDFEEIDEEDEVEMSFGIMDKMIGGVMSKLVKSLGKQMNELNRADVRSFPNGISISIGGGIPAKRQVVKKAREPEISEEKLNKIAKLPRVEVKGKIRRTADKVVYEFKAAGVESLNDIFVTKLEKGYEVKAIGKNKVYVGAIPVELQLEKYGFNENGMIFEFLGN